MLLRIKAFLTLTAHLNDGNKCDSTLVHFYSRRKRFFQDCEASHECLNGNCVPKSCRAPDVKHGRIVGVSPLATFAVEMKHAGGVVAIDEAKCQCYKTRGLKHCQ
jgi:hypothetical protein